MADTILKLRTALSGTNKDVINAESLKLVPVYLDSELYKIDFNKNKVYLSEALTYPDSTFILGTDGLLYDPITYVLDGGKYTATITSAAEILYFPITTDEEGNVIEDTSDTGKAALLKYKTLASAWSGFITDYLNAVPNTRVEVNSRLLEICDFTAKYIPFVDDTKKAGEGTAEFDKTFANQKFGIKILVAQE